jgi:AcrR family transcriptional regulator
LKEKIASAAERVLLEAGLPGWSIDRVAAVAGCAKGLVPYHHGSKAALLTTVGVRLTRARIDRRLAALTASGATEALDSLWEVLREEVRSGKWAAWTALAVGPRVTLPPESATDLRALGDAMGGVLGMAALRPEEVRLALAALDGLQLALHRGSPEELVHEAYHRLWLAFLP